MKVFIIGIGGASCSGKTLLAKHIASILPNASIIHQDDFAPPIEQVPYSVKFPDLQDWDDPATAILWDDFRHTMDYIKKQGKLPAKHQTHDHLNKQIEVDISPDVKRRRKEQFEEFGDTIFFLVDGFVLYWDEDIVSDLDVRIFLRVPEDILRRRREERQTYVMQTGDVWLDPPKYFDNIVYPAYRKAHKHLFADEDVERGKINPGMMMLSPLEGGEEMERAFETACQLVYDSIKSA